MRLAVMHNLYFYNHLLERIREELDAGTFEQFHYQYAAYWTPASEQAACREFFSPNLLHKPV